MTTDYNKALRDAETRLAETYPEEYAALVLEAMKERGVPLLACTTCGEPSTSDPRDKQNGDPATHAGECRTIWRALRLHLPAYRDAHRLTSAKGDIRRATDPIKVASAERQLAGTAATHGRWFVEGSMAWHAAVISHQRAYPIFDELSDELQEQVRKAVA